MDPSPTETRLDLGFALAPEGHGPGTPPPAVTGRDRDIARLLLAGALVGGAWLVLRVPSVRRLAWRGAKVAVLSWLPSLLAREAREAWRHSAAPGPGTRDAGLTTPAAVSPPGPFSGA